MREDWLEYVRERLGDRDMLATKVVGALPFRRRSEHTRRVAGWMEYLLEDMPGNIDCDAARVAAAFHDVGYAMDSKNHAAEGARLFREYAEENGFSEEKTASICSLIANHSRKELLREKDTPVELILLLEADLLDETGALSVVWDCMTEGLYAEQGYEKTYRHILAYSGIILEDNLMVTRRARELWMEKQALVRLFLDQLARDLHLPVETGAEERKCKAELEALEAENWALPEGTDMEAFCARLLAHIGAPDPELRDDLVYGAFYALIDNDRLPISLLRRLLFQCADADHLFLDIGNPGSDAVFTRTFSQLVIDLILLADLRASFLSEAEIRGLFDAEMRYCAEEADTRGYVPEKGWAHSMAHASDSLGSLAKNPLVDAAMLHTMLLRVRDMIRNDRYTYINEEDERLARACMAILGRGLLTEEQAADWLRGFAATERLYIYPQEENIRENSKCFLRSLYFRLKKAGYAALAELAEGLADGHIKA